MEQGVLAGVLKNGVKVELCEASSFSGNLEIGLKIGGELVNVVSVAGKRRGSSIECKTISTNIVRISLPVVDAPPVTKPRVPPTLSDVAPTR
jgi:hypothetical protein